MKNIGQKIILNTCFTTAYSDNRINDMSSWSKLLPATVISTILLCAVLSGCSHTSSDSSDNISDSSETETILNNDDVVSDSSTINDFGAEKAEKPLTLIGRWELLDIVSNKDRFNSDKVHNDISLFSGTCLEKLYFMSEYNTYWTVAGWTEDKLYINSNGTEVENTFETERDDSGDYLFLTLNDYYPVAERYGYKQAILVFTKTSDMDYDIQEIQIHDDLDFAFENDEHIHGKWKWYESVNNPNDYVPGHGVLNNAGFEGIVFDSNGEATIIYNTMTRNTKWSSGIIIEDNHLNHFEIRNIDGTDYLIMEMKTGDYNFSGKINVYRVLIRDDNI